VKKTCAQRETLAIAGFALDGKKWDGIYLGRRKGKELIYAGKVDNGFDAATAKDLQARLKPLIRETQPYAKKKSPIVASGSSRRCLPRSNTERSQPRARCVIRSSRESGRIYELARGLDVGDRHRRRRPRRARCRLPSDPNFCVWLSCEDHS
jgi:ATP-dependent DNA ligase